MTILRLPVRHPPARSFCLFRTCTWTLEHTAATMPPEKLEELVAAHLLAEHRAELSVLGRLAEHGDLL